MTMAATAQKPPELCEVREHGQEYALHLVELGDNLFRIAQLYNSTVEDIWDANPAVMDKTIIPGQVIKVPKNSKVVAPAVPVAAEKKGDGTRKSEVAPRRPEPVDSSKLVMHEVGPGQTLFAISRQYAVSVEDLQAWNGLAAYDIKVGQRLIVSRHGELKVFNETASEVESYKPSRQPVRRDVHVNTRQDLLYQRFLEESQGRQLLRERGAAGKLITNNPDMQTVYYALHKSAPVGSVLKVMNLVNRKYVFVTVLAPLPDIPENENVQVKLSPAATKDLVMLDGRSLVELSYYK